MRVSRVLREGRESIKKHKKSKKSSSKRNRKKNKKKQKKKKGAPFVRAASARAPGGATVAGLLCRPAIGPESKTRRGWRL